MKEVRVRRRDPALEKQRILPPSGYQSPARARSVARTIRPPAASTPWRMALATAHRGEFESLTPAVNLPRRQTELEALFATLMLALLFHTVAIFAFIVANPETSKSDYQFFSDVQLVEVATVDMVQMVKPAEAPKPAPPPPAQRPAIPPPQAAPAPQPQAPAPAPRPAPRPFAPRPQPVVNNPGPRVVAAQNSQGPPVHVGQGGGDPNGVPGGTGQGGDGTGGNGQGGNGGPPAGPPLQATTSAIEWNNYEKLGIGMPEDPTVRTRAAECQTWEQIAGVLGLDKTQLFSQPLVEPYCRGQRNPSLDEQYQIAGKTGSVTIKCRIDSSGRPTPQLLGTTGDPTMDQIAMKIAMDSMWLPAMQYGRIVDYDIQFELKFSSVQ